MSLLHNAAMRRQSDPNGEDPEVLARFNAHRHIAARLARRYHRSANRNDLGQVADMALVLAARRYDPEKGSFQPYAVVTIIGELKKYLRQTGWDAHVPRQVQEDSITVQTTIDRLSVELGRAPLLTEVAATAHLTPERVKHALQALPARFASRDLDSDLDVTSANTGETPADIVDLRAAVGRLSPEDRRFVSLLFDHDLTQSEVAAILGTSQTQVHRRLARIRRYLLAVLAERPA